MFSANSLLENIPAQLKEFLVEEDSTSPSSVTSSVEEYTKYSNPILRYINDILMGEEDNLENKPCMLQECLRLQAAEKSFYDVLGHNYPSSHNQIRGFFNDDDDGNNGCSVSFESNSTSYITDNSYESERINTADEFESYLLDNPLVDTSENTNDVDVAPDPSQAAKRNAIRPQNKAVLIGENAVQRVKRSHQVDGNSHEENERGSKISAVFSDNSEPLELLDEVLRVQIGGRHSCTAGETSSENETFKPNVVDSGGGSIGKAATRSKKGTNTETTTGVDLWTLLTQCAQAVASYDQRNANELLNQIRQHSSPFGDGLQRLSHYFAIGLETRLAAGTPSYTPFDMVTAADMLKAYKLQVQVFPLQRMSNLLTTRKIVDLVKNEGTLHIIDFGISYGFQWPCLIKHLSQRRGGSPKVRMTGIDFPQPGFRPAERLQETGQRLENYCKRHNVPFEYNCIAQKWETIRLEDLKIDKTEVTVVNCLYRMKNLPDETVSVNSARDALLKLFRKINPNIFIHGVVNGTYSAPFFLTRFRETLFHFSSLFDMFEANVDREDTERVILEKGLFGRDAINVIACEGAERVERPETYKQWQVRNLRAGFKQLRLDPELVNEAKEMVKSEYHKDFVVDENGKWVLLGWKGRILNAVSAWIPA
ncbi:hypothetical protein TanjilG_30249 [Lupinus angustifolius]|uniref:Uncharacterized protein n=1 Tax=Lupinus angustifolius TaxID=3871 RepID=A0A4P1R706_LUPAN|nr:PREDICTED: scarecrow-like protein 11 [Lupinus angustifolius]OIW03973.1 hypothetical protein TanjilG_30249 [Lupinus angustifolius]